MPDVIPIAPVPIGHTEITYAQGMKAAHHFVSDLSLVYPALRVWHDRLDGAPIPFAALRTALPVPGCDILFDMWAYRPLN